MSASRVTYREIMTDLLGRIEAGELGIGDLLPSERDLSESTGAAIGTVHRAMTELAALGITEGRRGTGHVIMRTEPAKQTLRDSGGHLDEARRSLVAAQTAGAEDVKMAQAYALVSIAESLATLSRRQ